MPKVTVYIQNELWRRIKERPAGTNVSQLVQRALENELGVGAAAVETEKARDIVDRMRTEARAIYDAGVSAGMDLAEHLSWSQLDRLQEAGWDVDRWLEGDEKGGIDGTLAGLMDEWRDSHGPGTAQDQGIDMHLAASEFETASYREGWMNALKGVWGAVMSDLRMPELGGRAE